MTKKVSKKKAPRKDVQKGTMPLKEAVIDKARYPAKAEKCLRYIDKSNVAMSSDPRFKKYDPKASIVVPEGMKKIDASTILPK